MNTQPEDLRLADALDDPRTVVFFDQRSKAAAEQRRLTAVEAERDALKQTLRDELAGNLRLRNLGGARPDEPMLTFLERIIAERDALLESCLQTGAELRRLSAVEAQRDALLEALKELMVAADGVNAGPQTWLTRARAAIKAVEGEKE